MRSIEIKHSNRQRGSALIVSLVILLIMTIIGVQSISSTSLEEKMAGNYRSSQLSFQAAEAALRQAEEFIENTTFNLPHMQVNASDSDFSANCTNGLCFNGSGSFALECSANNPSSPPWKDFTNIWDGAKHRSFSGSMPGVSTLPKYIVEFRCCVPADLNVAPDPSNGYCANGEWAEMYRVTALGYGGTDQARTMLQSTFKKDVN